MILFIIHINNIYSITLMKYQNFVTFLIIPLALFSTLSLLDNAQAQTNSSASNQTTSPSQQQQMNITAQALMETDIIGIKDTLAKAKLEIIQDNLKEALQDVRDVETQLLLVEPSPTKLLSNIHKAINAIAKSNIDKALDTLTNVQVTILKAENQIFKAAVENPQVMQQFINIEENANEEDSLETEEDYDDTIQQLNIDTNIN
jgi:hypothetical protein